MRFVPLSGYYGERTRLTGGKQKEFDWYSSLFGGSISAVQEAMLRDWPNGDNTNQHILSHCECCKKPLTLVARIHAPESLCQTSTPLSGLAAIADNSILSPNYKPPQGEDDDQIRVLIIACCNEKHCWKVGRASWKAYRWQPHIVLTEAEIKQIKDAKAAAFRKTLQTPHYKDEDDKAPAKKTPSSTPTKSLFAMPQWASPFGGSSAPAASPSASSSGASQDIEELLKVRDLQISPQPQKTAKTSKAVSAADSPSKPSEKKDDAPISAATNKETDEFAFTEAYIEFDKEPEIASYSGSYEGYEKKANESLSEGAEGTWAGEAYESGVTAKDKPFHRFHKRLQRAPQQCLRYWRGAEPLYSAANPPKQIPLCSCGARRVPETQLTPALIYLLRPTNDKHESNLEFGTVIVYTCSVNCTQDSSPLHVEHIEIQKGS